MRFFFIVYNGKIASTLPYGTLGMSFLYGLRLDLSMAAYISVIPLLLSLLAQSNASKVVNKIMLWYTYLLLAVVTILSLVDAQLYAFWGQKIDAYASSFAKFPKDMLSFSGAASVGKLVFFLFLSFFAITIPFDSLVIKFDKLANMPKKATIWLYFVVSGAVLFLFIRGNVGMSPINQSFVYYSEIPFCNHAAVNTTWNFMASVLDNSEVEKKNTYQFIPQAQAQQLVADLFSSTKTSTPIKITSQTNPNILFIILEGWTADVVGFTGGDSTVTPRLNYWSRQGLTYNNFYANGNRTDKGLAAILSAQPALSRSSIINKLQKFTNLPALPKSLATIGYNSSFVYGGEAEFANMKAYWINSGYTSITDINQFNQPKMPENWGVHDNELYAKLLTKMAEVKSPAFVTALTLSSHEPYNVPHTSQFTGTTQADLYKNSVNFADKCLGDFLTQASQQAWYNNTLIFILSDHAHQEPLNRSPFEPARFHIPFLVTGGALNQSLKGVTVAKICQQTDLAPSLLNTLGINNASYNWGKNMFDTTATTGFATYTFTDGIGLITPAGYVVFDQVSKKVLETNAPNNTPLVNQARAYQQEFYSQYLAR